MEADLIQKLHDEVHIWLTCPEDITDPHTLDSYAALLSIDERERWQRFHFDRDRHSYLVSHALVRRVLSKYAAIEPQDWRFSNGAQGRPEIVAGPGVPPLRFNLSHTRGMAACVVTREIACGIDVERLVARGNPQAIADRMFAPAEIEDLGRQDAATYLQQFFTYWTLREAYYKALGTGIAFSDNRHAFVMQEAGRYRLDVEPAAGDAAASDWYFEVHQPSA